MRKTKMTMELPKIGDKLIRVMTGKQTDPTIEVRHSEPCVVTYVNREHSWYEVAFVNTNLREAYRLPSFDHSILDGTREVSTPVACLETGFVYPAISDCAYDMGLNTSGVSLQLRGKSSNCNGYHFVAVM